MQLFVQLFVLGFRRRFTMRGIKRGRWVFTGVVVVVVVVVVRVEADES